TAEISPPPASCGSPFPCGTAFARIEAPGAGTVFGRNTRFVVFSSEFMWIEMLASPGRTPGPKTEPTAAADSTPMGLPPPPGGMLKAHSLHSRRLPRVGTYPDPPASTGRRDAGKIGDAMPYGVHGKAALPRPASSPGNNSPRRQITHKESRNGFAEICRTRRQ